MSDKFDGFSVNLIYEDSGEWLAHFISTKCICFWRYARGSTS